MLEESLLKNLSAYDREQNLREYLHELSGTLNKTNGAIKDTFLIKRKGVYFMDVVLKDGRNQEICIDGCDYAEIADILTELNIERRERK